MNNKEVEDMMAQKCTAIKSITPIGELRCEEKLINVTTAGRGLSMNTGFMSCPLCKIVYMKE